MKTYYLIITVFFTLWFLASVIIAKNINDLKDNCFIYVLLLCFIAYGVYLNYKEDDKIN